MGEASPVRSTEEADPLAHPQKKIKPSEPPQPPEPGSKSFKDSLTGAKGSWSSGGKDVTVDLPEEDSDDELDERITGDIPMVKLTKEMKTALRAPWRKALIVKNCSGRLSRTMSYWLG